MKSLKLIAILILNSILSYSQNPNLVKITIYKMNLQATKPIGLTCNDLIDEVTKMYGINNHYIDTIISKPQLESIQCLINSNIQLKNILSNKKMRKTNKVYPDVRVVVILDFDNNKSLKLCFGTISNMVVNEQVYKLDKPLFDRLLTLTKRQP